MKFQSAMCLVLMLSMTLIPGVGQATQIGFDAMTPGLSVVFFDVNGDGFGDVIFNNLDGNGFEAGFAPQPTLIDGPGLKGSSLSEMDLEIIFPHGATDYLQFDFALTTYQNEPGGHAYIWLYDAAGNPVGNAHTIYVQPTGDPERHEAPVFITLDAIVATAKMNFISQGGGSWYVIDNFEGNFAPPPADIALLSVFPELANLGKTPLNTPSQPLTITISNDGDTDYVFGEVSVSGDHASQFSITNDQCSYQVLGPLETATLDIVFTPFLVGKQKAKLGIAMDDEHIQGPEITVKGTGCPHIKLIRPNPATPGETVVVVGEGFDHLQWIKVGNREFQKKSKKVNFWDSDYVILELPSYDKWEDDVTVEKPVTVAVQDGDKILKSNKYPLDIQKP
jgi:hypothetical protein